MTQNSMSRLLEAIGHGAITVAGTVSEKDQAAMQAGVAAAMNNHVSRYEPPACAKPDKVGEVVNQACKDAAARKTTRVASAPPDPLETAAATATARYLDQAYGDRTPSKVAKGAYTVDPANEKAVAKPRGTVAMSDDAGGDETPVEPFPDGEDGAPVSATNRARQIAEAIAKIALAKFTPFGNESPKYPEQLKFFKRPEVVKALVDAVTERANNSLERNAPNAAVRNLVYRELKKLWAKPPAAPVDRLTGVVC